MNRKYYLVLILVLSVSVLLLGLSYSKDSSNNKYNNEFESYDRNLRIVTSDNVKNFTVNDEVVRDISVTNKSGYKTTFVVEVISDNLDGLSYAIGDDDKQVLQDKIIYTKELNSFGLDGDHDSVEIKLFSDDNKNVSLRIYEQVNYLQDVIEKSVMVYKDEIDNYHYFGNEVNNYARYAGKDYRIVGIINNKIVLISEKDKNSIYQPKDDNYLTIALYLDSFNDDNVKINNVKNYRNWLTDSYWLLDTYGNDRAYYMDNGSISSVAKDSNLQAREIIKLAIDTEYILGDGTKNNPYEVVYDG